MNRVGDKHCHLHLVKARNLPLSKSDLWIAVQVNILLMSTVTPSLANSTAASSPMPQSPATRRTSPSKAEVKIVSSGDRDAAANGADVEGQEGTADPKKAVEELEEKGQHDPEVSARQRDTKQCICVACLFGSRGYCLRTNAKHSFVSLYALILQPLPLSFVKFYCQSLQPLRIIMLCTPIVHDGIDSTHQAAARAARLSFLLDKSTIYAKIIGDRMARQQIEKRKAEARAEVRKANKEKKEAEAKDVKREGMRDKRKPKGMDVESKAESRGKRKRQGNSGRDEKKAKVDMDEVNILIRLW